MKYHAFISYSHRDKNWGDWLHKALETYKVPKALVGTLTPRGETVPPRVFPVFRVMRPEKSGHGILSQGENHREKKTL